MVVLAQALVSRPRIVLVDELSLGLAPIVVQRLVPTIEAVARSGVGVLLIEQFAHVALGLAQTAYVLERGRIHYHGTAQRLKDEPELLQSAYLLRDVDPGGEAPSPEEPLAERLDSLQLLTLVVAVEDRFHVVLTDDDAARARSLSDLARLVADRAPPDRLPVLEETP